MYDKTVDEGGTRFAFNGSSYYMKSADEMYAALRSGGFSDGDAKAALTGTSVIAEMCEGGFSVIEYDQHADRALTWAARTTPRIWSVSPARVLRLVTRVRLLTICA